MGLLVEAVARRIVAFATEPVGHRNAIAESGEFHHRQIEEPPVEGHQRRHAEFFPAAPKRAGDDLGPETRPVEGLQFDQGMISGNFGHRHRHRHLEGMWHEIAASVRRFQQLLAMGGDSGGRRQLGLVGQAHPLDQPAIGHGLDVEDEECDAFSHGRMLGIGGLRQQPQRGRRSKTPPHARSESLRWTGGFPWCISIVRNYRAGRCDFAKQERSKYMRSSRKEKTLGPIRCMVRYRLTE